MIVIKKTNKKFILNEEIELFDLEAFNSVRIVLFGEKDLAWLVLIVLGCGYTGTSVESMMSFVEDSTFMGKRKKSKEIERRRMSLFMVMCKA